MGELPYTQFFDAEKMSTFWQWTGAVLFFVLPLLIIGIATDAAGYFISVIRDVFKFRSKQDEERYDYKTKNEKY
jgi:hypothetical protein